MGKRGRKPIDKTVEDLDDTLRGEIDEALRSDARESASSVFRRFGLAQRGLRLDTFIRYARKLRQVLWTDEPPLDRTTPSIEEIRDRLLVLMYEQAQAGGMKAYECAALFQRVQEHDRIEIIREANERAAEKHEAWKDEVAKKVRSAIDGQTRSGETMTRDQVADMIDDIIRGKA